MKHACILAPLVLVWSFGLQAEEGLRTLDELNAAIKDLGSEGRTFDYTGKVRYYYPTENDGWNCTLGDATNQIESFASAEFLRSGEEPPVFHLLDTVRIVGKIALVNGKPSVRYTEITHVENGDIKKLSLDSPLAIYLPDNLQRMLRLHGIVRDASIDDSDPNFIHLTIADADGQAQVMVIQPTFVAEAYSHLIGAEVIVSGLCSDNRHGLRRHVGRLLAVAGMENVTILAKPKDFADAADLETLADALPQAVAGSSHCQTEGTILATWGGNALLLKTANDRVVKVRLQEGDLPPFGTHIKAIGLPVTDFYHLNLIHARWEPSNKKPAAAAIPKDIAPKNLLTNESGHPQLMIRHHGEAIQLTGTVRYLPENLSENPRLQIECGGQLVSVDISSLPTLADRLSVGSRISIAGTCVMNADDWHIDSTAWQPTGFFLVPRTIKDLTIISQPSWWTYKRMLGLLGLMLSALIGTIIWNISLNRRARRKGKQLAEEQLARVTSELKVGERTRLAVELHDALSQTLTGVSMQVDTAAGLSRDPALSSCLTLASRTIDSCRLELRNTLWDLRSEALDEPDFNTAIRRTLCQNLAGIKLTVRFNVSRKDFPDDIVHAVMRIVRELATNALRHGHATAIHIAGTMDGDKLKFSVKDNGCGFDPDKAPGISQGHFGLQGISERLCRIDGEMTVESREGQGTRISVTIPINR